MADMSKPPSLRHTIWLITVALAGAMWALIVQQYRLPDNSVFGVSLGLLLIFAWLLISMLSFRTKPKRSVAVSLLILSGAGFLALKLWEVTHQPPTVVVKSNRIAGEIISFATKRANNGGGQAIITEFESTWSNRLEKVTEEMRDRGCKMDSFDNARRKINLESGRIWEDIKSVGEALRDVAKTVK